MESITFLPVTKTELYFLSGVIGYHRGTAGSLSLKIKINKLIHPENTLTPDKIVSQVCGIKEVTEEELRSRKKDRKFVDARICVSVLIHELFPRLSLNQIGIYTNKDHASVLHHYKLAKECPEVRRVYDELKLKLKI